MSLYQQMYSLLISRKIEIALSLHKILDAQVCREKKTRSLRRIKACQTDLLWIYSLSSYLCSSCLFGKSDSLLSHYTACFHMRHSFNIEFCILYPMSLFLLPPSFHRLTSKRVPPAWHGPLGQPHAATGAPLGASKCSPALLFNERGSNARENSTQESASFPLPLPPATTIVAIMASSLTCPCCHCHGLRVPAAGDTACHVTQALLRVPCGTTARG